MPEWRSGLRPAQSVWTNLQPEQIFGPTFGMNSAGCPSSLLLVGKKNSHIPRSERGVSVGKNGDLSSEDRADC